MESRTVEIKEVKVNDDGSATTLFDFTAEEVLAFYRAGVIQAMKNGIKEAEQYSPTRPSKFSTKQFQLTWDQLDHVVTSELKDCYETQIEHDAEGRDYELIHALNVVLKYYMDHSDYDEWKNTLDE